MNMTAFIIGFSLFLLGSDAELNRGTRNVFANLPGPSFSIFPPESGYVIGSEYVPSPYNDEICVRYPTSECIYSVGGWEVAFQGGLVISKSVTDARNETLLGITGNAQSADQYASFLRSIDEQSLCLRGADNNFDYCKAEIPGDAMCPDMILFIFFDEAGHFKQLYIHNPAGI